MRISICLIFWHLWSSLWLRLMPLFRSYHYVWDPCQVSCMVILLTMNITAVETLQNIREQIKINTSSIFIFIILALPGVSRDKSCADIIKRQIVYKWRPHRYNICLHIKGSDIWQYTLSLQLRFNNDICVAFRFSCLYSSLRLLFSRRPIRDHGGYV